MKVFMKKMIQSYCILIIALFASVFLQASTKKSLSKKVASEKVDTLSNPDFTTALTSTEFQNGLASRIQDLEEDNKKLKNKNRLLSYEFEQLQILVCQNLQRLQDVLNANAAVQEAMLQKVEKESAFQKRRLDATEEQSALITARAIRIERNIDKVADMIERDLKRKGRASLVQGPTLPIQQQVSKHFADCYIQKSLSCDSLSSLNSEDFNDLIADIDRKEEGDSVSLAAKKFRS